MRISYENDTKKVASFSLRFIYLFKKKIDSLLLIGLIFFFSFVIAFLARPGAHHGGISNTLLSLSLSIHEEKRIDFSSSPFFIPRQPQNGYLILADAIPNTHAHTRRSLSLSRWAFVDAAPAAVPYPSVISNRNSIHVIYTHTRLRERRARERVDFQFSMMMIHPSIHFQSEASS